MAAVEPWGPCGNTGLFFNDVPFGEDRVTATVPEALTSAPNSPVAEAESLSKVHS